VARISLTNPPEVFVSTAAISAAVSRAVAAGKLRKLGSRLYTTNLKEEPSTLVRRLLWEIAAGFFPGGLVADRTALEQRPTPDGSVFLVAPKGGKVVLPGVTLHARRGTGLNTKDNCYPGPLPARRSIDLFSPSEEAHNLKVVGSNPTPATSLICSAEAQSFGLGFFRSRRKAPESPQVRPESPLATYRCH